MPKLTEKEQQARKRACLALDVPTVPEALSLAEELAPYFETSKVGKQLHIAAGSEGINIVRELEERGIGTFLDLKFHDTPNTVYEASRACAVPGVYMFNLHIAGGEEMCRRAIDGASDGIITRPKVIGVTVLTSLDDEDLKAQGLGVSYNDLLRRRTELAKKWGLDGVVCPANKAGELEKEFGSDFLYVTPDIKWADKQGAGQKQLYTPDRAVRDCSNSMLVIGSAVTKAKDKPGTAYKILQAMAAEL